MSGAPAISFPGGSDPAVEVLEDKFKVSLYSHQELFKQYYDWASPVGSAANTF
jgi:hypothetical protein